MINTAKLYKSHPNSTLRASIKSIFAFLVVFVLLCGTTFVPQAQAQVQKSDLIAGQSVEDRGLAVSQCPDIEATHAYVMDENGSVYFSRDATSDAKIASITKIMTAVVALENASLDSPVTVSANAAEIGEASAGLQEGDSMPLSTALRAMLIPSGNDAAEAIAESVGAQMLQNEGQNSSDPNTCMQRFVQAMNDEASQLGLVNTVYRNPHGLDDEQFAGDQHSCAQDVANLSRYAMTKDQIRDSVDKQTETIQITRNGQTVDVDLTSTDELIGNYDGACGLKTGFTQDAGACFAGVCQRDGHYLYTVVLNSPTEAQRFTDTVTLWDWTYQHNISYKLAQSPQTTVDAQGNTVPLVATVSDGAWMDKTVNATLRDPDQAVTLFDLAGNVSQEASYDDISGTVHAGDQVGTITFKQHNDVIATADLVATEDVPAPGFLEQIGIWGQKLIAQLTYNPTQADSTLINETPMINDRSRAAA